MSHKISKILTNNNVKIKVLRYYNQGVKHLDLSILNPDEISKYTNFKSDKRKLEFYYSRILWHSFNIDLPIQYKLTGKPILKKGFISISHSHHKVAIGYSEFNKIGIDLEFKSKKVQKIKHKYLHDSENYKTITDLTIIWTIKEAIYKLYDNDKLFFKDHIEVSLNDKLVNVKVNLLNNLLVPKLTFFKIGKDYILSYAY